MRNHDFVEEVVSKMLEFNHNEYLIDIDELININQYGNTISTILSQIKNILTNDLNILTNQNNNYNYRIIKNSLKTYIYQILIFNNGRECCKKLICKE